MHTSTSDDGRGLVVQHTAVFVKALQTTLVFQRFADALSRFETDSDVQRLLADFQRQAEAFQHAQQHGHANAAQVGAIRQAQARVQAHPIVREFVEAQQALGLFLQETNAAISETLGMDFGQTAGPGPAARVEAALARLGEIVRRASQIVRPVNASSADGNPEGTVFQTG